MHDSSYPVLGERGTEVPAIRKIALDERPPTHRLAVPARQIVKDDRSISGARQHLAGVRPYISGPARYEDRL
jgi:hypothetical protein